MADEITLNLLEGWGEEKWTSFMFTRSTGYPSGNWGTLQESFKRVVIDGHQFPNKDYYSSRPYLPIAGKPLIKWSE